MKNKTKFYLALLALVICFFISIIGVQGKNNEIQGFGLWYGMPLYFAFMFLCGAGLAIGALLTFSLNADETTKKEQP